MQEKDAIELLGKLDKFMREVPETIKNLMVIIHNQQVDIDNLKKNVNQNKIIVRN